MTKMKSKKMTKSTFAIIIMAIVMVAMLAFGGTYALFTATANNTVGTGAKTALIKLSNDNSETLTAASTNALPGESVYTGDITLKDESTRGTWVFAKVSVYFGTTKVEVSDTSKLVITPDADWKTEGLTDAAGVYYIENSQADGEYDKVANATLTFTLDVKLAAGLDETYIEDTSTDTGMNYMNKTVTVYVQFASVQHKDVTTAAQAYTQASAKFATFTAPTV